MESLAGERLGGPKAMLQKLLRRKTRVEESDIFAEPRKKKGFLTGILSASRESILREFQWPWGGEQTWNGIRRGFGIVLMFIAVLLILRITSIPSCGSDFGSTFSLSHFHPPRT